jgi:hypothetical protein
MTDGGKLLIIKYLSGQQKMAQKIDNVYCGHLTRRQMVFSEVQALNYGDSKAWGESIWRQDENACGSFTENSFRALGHFVGHDNPDLSALRANRLRNRERHSH